MVFLSLAFFAKSKKIFPIFQVTKVMLRSSLVYLLKHLSIHILILMSHISEQAFAMFFEVITDSPNLKMLWLKWYLDWLLTLDKINLKKSDEVLKDALQQTNG